MKLKRRHKFRAEVATASLNDIMFFLLLFFLIIATVVNPNVIKILLPKSDSNQTLSKKQISLTITADKTYFLDKEPVSFQQLEPKLMEATKRKGSIPMSIIRGIAPIELFVCNVENTK